MKEPNATFKTRRVRVIRDFGASLESVLPNGFLAGWERLDDLRDRKGTLSRTLNREEYLQPRFFVDVWRWFSRTRNGILFIRLSGKCWNECNGSGVSDIAGQWLTLVFRTAIVSVPKGGSVTRSKVCLFPFRFFSSKSRIKKGTTYHRRAYKIVNNYYFQRGFRMNWKEIVLEFWW